MFQKAIYVGRGTKSNGEFQYGARMTGLFGLRKNRKAQRIMEFNISAVLNCLLNLERGTSRISQELHPFFPFLGKPDIMIVTNSVLPIISTAK